MEALIQYKFKCNELFFKFHHEQISREDLIKGLREVEAHAKKNIPKPKHKSLWFKFTHDDTGSSTIREIDNELNPMTSTQRNREYMKLNISLAVENPDGLRVFFS